MFPHPACSFLGSHHIDPVSSSHPISVILITHRLADLSFVLDGQVWPPSADPLDGNERGADSPCPLGSCLPSASHFCSLVSCGAKTLSSLGSGSHDTVTSQNLLARKAFSSHPVSSRYINSICRLLSSTHFRSNFWGSLEP